MLPAYEEFGDAYDGKYFVRIPRGVAVPVPSRHARLRSEAPSLQDSLWLPDHCVVGDNTLEVEKRTRFRPKKSVALLGTAAPSIMHSRR